MQTQKFEINQKQDLPEIIELIGTGSFGHVVLAYDHKLKKKIAIKRSLKVNKNLSKEIKIYRIINDSIYVPELLDIYFTIDNTGRKIIQNLVFEYVPSKKIIFIFKIIKKNLLFYFILICFILFYLILLFKKADLFTLIKKHNNEETSMSMEMIKGIMKGLLIAINDIHNKRKEKLS
jgi:serine/threonine protein kinase